MTHSFSATTLQTGLSEEDLNALGISGHRIETVPKGNEICSSHEYIHVLIEGWACKYRILNNGTRHVISINLSGEICDIDKIFFPLLAFSAQAVSTCRVAMVPIDHIKTIVSTNSDICTLFWSLTTLENIAISEIAMNLGRRSAIERMAWLFCNLEDRLRSRGQLEENSFRLEVVQTDIADLLGLSQVHTNRCLKELRLGGLLGSRGSQYTVLDLAGLRAIAGYEKDALLRAN